LRIFFIFLIVVLCLASFPPIHAAETVPNTNNLIYLYGGTGEKYKSLLSGTKGQAGTLAPDYFELDAHGNLQSTVDTAFVQWAQQQGFRVTPFLSNHWDYALGALAMQNRSTLARQVADAVLLHNLDGINIDIENLTPLEKDAQTEFLQLLTSHLRPHGKTVSLAVAPAVQDTNYGWYGSYDYAAIGRIVDTVFIMAYDQHYYGGPAGPVAGYEWMRSSIRYLSGKIPKEKLVLGVPFYGRYWNDQVKGQAVTYASARDLIDQHGAATQWDAVQQTPYAAFTDPVTGMSYEIWFDNAMSLQNKLALAAEFGLKGWGGWKLGQEDPAVWAALATPILPGQAVATKALQYVGRPITNFHSGDFVSFVYRKKGITLPSDLRSLSRQGSLVTQQAALRAGDVLFFGTNVSKLLAVGIYTGHGEFVVAHKPYGHIRKLQLSSFSVKKYYLGAKRIIP
jgi:spore germination protein YaaH